MKKYRNKTFTFNPELDKAYRQLFRTSPAGCSVCGEESIESLDIHQVDSKPDFQVLCNKCYASVHQ